MACSNRQASFSAVLGSTPASIKRSVKNGVFHKSFQEVLTLICLWSLRNLCVRCQCLESRAPVSYTHLDVYKRQGRSQWLASMGREWTIAYPDSCYGHSLYRYIRRAFV